jgi:cytoskeletal protein CcmA (bactofilin family)
VTSDDLSHPASKIISASRLTSAVSEPSSGLITSSGVRHEQRLRAFPETQAAAILWSARRPSLPHFAVENSMNLAKKLCIAVVLFLLLPLSVSAQDLRKGGSLFARVETNGDVRIRGQIVGRFETDGDIRVKGTIVGRIERDGDIRRKGTIVGQVEQDGDVRMNGRIVGKVESDGDIRKAGQIIGRAAGVKKEYAAAIFFFGFFD